MARDLNVIQNEILTDIASNTALVEMNSTSRSAIYRVLTYVVAFSIWAFEKILDIHKIQIDQAILQQKSGTQNWYKNKSLAFQYGFDLVTDTDVYDNSLSTIEVVEDSKIVKYCSVKESTESNRLIVKIASEIDAVLEPLTPDQLESFTTYIQEIKYAGVKIKVVNNPADILVFDLVVYRDPLVINDQGVSILNGNKPVEDRILAYMKELPFNGELLMNDLIEQLRNVPGVNNVYFNSAGSSAYDIDGYGDFTFFTVARIPEAGYFKVENFNTVSYVV